MGPAELLQSRADVLLSEAATQGKAATLFTLEGIAGAMLPDVPPEDRRAAVNEAIKRANREERTSPPPGYRPPSERRAEKPRRPPAAAKQNGGIPKRTPPLPAKKVAERSIAPAVERWNPATLRAFLLEQLRAKPDATGPQLWEAACRVRQPHVSEASFKAAYMPEARKALRSAPGTVAHLRHQPTRDEPEAPEDASQDGRDDGAAHSAAAGNSGTVGEGSAPTPDGGGVRGAAVPQGEPGPNRAHADRDEHREVAEAAPSASSELRNAESAPAPLERPGSIEISRPHDTFRATQRPDGTWDVVIRAEAVDHPVMDQLAAVMWDRIVGIRGGGAREPAR